VQPKQLEQPDRKSDSKEIFMSNKKQKKQKTKTNQEKKKKQVEK
jgi:hypothetical protein